jgi:hypothetical protein
VEEERLAVLAEGRVKFIKVMYAEIKKINF